MVSQRLDHACCHAGACTIEGLLIPKSVEPIVAIGYLAVPEHELLLVNSLAYKSTDDGTKALFG